MPATGMSQYKSAPRFHEQHLQKEKLLWVRAEDSKIDPKKDPLPLVMFGPKCRFRPLCLDALEGGTNVGNRLRRRQHPGHPVRRGGRLGTSVVTPMHRKAALNAGVTEQELAEATFVAAALHAGGAVAHGSHLVD